MMLSIVIPSFQRADLLEFGLASLAKQTITCDYEVIVLNDGVVDDTEAICTRFSKILPMKYVYTGYRNAKELKWRIPGFAINIGAKLAQGKNMIITCPEIYVLNNCVEYMVELLNENPKRLVITEGKDDRGANFLNALKFGTDHNILTQMFDGHTGNTHPLNTEYPFFMGMSRQAFLDIGGYDEDFVGFCWDDLDVVTRLQKSGCQYHKITAKIVHLYNPRLRYGLEDTKVKWKDNEKMFYDRITIIKRNEGRAWGVLDVPSNVSS